jgi:molybdenum cofactor guanylyltransferase
MGRAKAALEWHGSTLLQRTTALLARTVRGPVLVVAAPGQELPDLPAGVEVVADPVEGLGPMRGLATGLAALDGRAATAFVCSTDLPFLHPALVRRVLREFADPEVDVAMPVTGGHRQPLAAGYRTALAPLVEELLRAGDLRPGMLFRHCRVFPLDDDALLSDPDLARHDPELDSLVNVNKPAEYAAALGRPEPTVVVERFGQRRPRTIRAASVGAAAVAVGVALDRHVAAVNSDHPTRDPQLPLVAGDTVVFLPSDVGGRAGRQVAWGTEHTDSPSAGPGSPHR